MQSQTPILNCKKVYFVSTDNILIIFYIFSTLYIGKKYLKINWFNFFDFWT